MATAATASAAVAPLEQCSFEPQHYRRNMCRLCFLPASSHAAPPCVSAAASPSEADQLQARRSVTAAIDAVPKARTNSISSRADELSLPRAVPDTVVASASAAVAPAPPSPEPASAAAEVPAQIPRPLPEVLQSEAADVDDSSDARSNEGSEAHELAPAAASSQMVQSDLQEPELESCLAGALPPDAPPVEEPLPEAEVHDVEHLDALAADMPAGGDDVFFDGDDAGEDGAAVPMAPPLDNDFAPPPPPVSRRGALLRDIASGPRLRSATEQQTAASASSAAAAAATPRGALLSAIASAPRLRRVSEQVARPRPPIVADLNSELTWAIRRKHKQDPTQRAAADAAAKLPESARHFLTEFAARFARVDAAGPASLHVLKGLLEERDLFVSRYSTLLAAPSSSAPGGAAAVLEHLEPSWPAGKIALIEAFLAGEAKLRACTAALQRYTAPFEEYQRAQAALRARRRVMSGSPLDDMLVHTTPASAASSMDWLVLDADILERAGRSLCAALLGLRRLGQEGDGALAVDVTEARDAAQHAASTLVDLLFEKCAHAYVAVGGNPGSCSDAGPAAASVSVDGSALQPSYSQSSKSLRSFHCLSLSLSLFTALQDALGPGPDPTGPRFTFSASRCTRRDKLAALMRAIEASPAYRARIAVSQRKGNWDVKEEVTLRPTAARGAPAAAGVSSSTAATSLLTRRSSSTLDSRDVNASLDDLKPAHPRLFALLERLPLQSATPSGAVSVSSRAEQASAFGTDATVNELESSAGAPVVGSAVDTELRELLLPLKDAPVSVVAQLLLRYSIPRHDAQAYRFVVEELLLPRRPSGTDDAELLQTAAAEPAQALTAQREWHQHTTALLHECVSKAFMDGVRMTVARGTSGADDGAALPSLGVGPDARSLTFGSAGHTALHLAAAKLHIPLMLLLIRAGADPLAVNSHERTPLFSLRSLFGGRTGTSAAADALAPWYPHLSSGGVGSSSTSSSAATDVLAPNPATHFTARFFKSPRLADVRLRVETGADGDGGWSMDDGADATAVETMEVYAHRMVLCAQSDFFRALLEPDDDAPGARKQWADSAVSARPASGGGGLDDDESDTGAASSGPPMVVLPCVPSLAAFDLVLRFLYTGSLLFVSEDLRLPAQVLLLATRLLIDPLRALAAQHLAARVMVGNVDGLLRLAQHTQCTLLLRRCQQFVIENYAALLQARPSLAEEAEVDGAGELDPAPHAFLRIVLAGLDVAELQAAQQLQGRHAKWKI